MEIAGYCGHPAMAIILYKNVWPLLERPQARKARKRNY